MILQNLIIEVTRKCNMKCRHCLRGGAQSVNIDLKHITTLLQQTDEIYQVTFTGGEPSLNVEALKHFIKEAKRNNVYVGSFYIATNGKRVTLDFLSACLELYALCEDKEMCSLQVSNDMYHMEEFRYNDELLQGLSFYSKKFDDNERYSLINEGRAKISGRGEREANEYQSKPETMDDFNECELYLNALGQMVYGCNLSYSSQKNYVICDVKDLKKFYISLED